MEVGGGAPYFHQGWSIELEGPLVGRSRSADIIRLEVGEQAGFVAGGAADARAIEERAAAFGCG
jgi:hypothetical protein